MDGDGRRKNLPGREKKNCRSRSGVTICRKGSGLRLLRTLTEDCNTQEEEKKNN